MWMCKGIEIQGLTRYFRLISKYCVLTIASLCLLLYFSGCSPDPVEHHVRDAIHAYFKTRDLQVVKLEIQNIEQEPLGARQYMGPKRYIVQIPLITLRPVKAKGMPVDYQNATITIRKNTNNLYGWSVDNFSEIPLR
jgi:hypothetical protein